MLAGCLVLAGLLVLACAGCSLLGLLLLELLGLASHSWTQHQSMVQEHTKSNQEHSEIHLELDLPKMSRNLLIWSLWLVNFLS